MPYICRLAQLWSVSRFDPQTNRIRMLTMNPQREAMYEGGEEESLQATKLEMKALC